MPVLCARAADNIVGAGKHPWNIKIGPGVALLAALMAAGCSAVPPAPPALAADPQVPVPAARYSSVTAPYTSQRPVEPLPWRERNERVAPQAGP